MSDQEEEKGLRGELRRQRIVQEEGEKRGNKKEGEERRCTGEERNYERQTFGEIRKKGMRQKEKDGKRGKAKYVVYNLGHGPPSPQ